MGFCTNMCRLMHSLVPLWELHKNLKLIQILTILLYCSNVLPVSVAASCLGFTVLNIECKVDTFLSQTCAIRN